MKNISTVMKISMLISFILSIGISYGQLTLKGQVQSSNGDPLPFANVLLLDPSDSTLIIGDVAGSDGYFSFDNLVSNRYIINCMMIGFEPDYRLIEVQDGKMDPIKIQMEESLLQLSDVTVEAEKPLYEKKPDRMVINVQSKVTSSGRSVLEVLERSPGVIVNRQGSSISMYGKSGVRVMINGRISQLPTDAVVQMLNGMNAANIEKIELITSPPAKYDAEGNAGIINIVMKENADQGTSGDFGLTSGYNQAEILGGNFNLNYRGDRFNHFMDYSILSDKNNQPWINLWTFEGGEIPVTDFSDQQRSFRLTVQNLRVGTSYELSDKTEVDLLLTGYQRLWNMPDAFTQNVRNFEDSVVYTDMDINEKNKWSSWGMSTGLNHQFENGQSFSMNYDYLYFIHDNPSSYGFEPYINNTRQESFLIDVYKETPLSFHVFTFDYKNPLSANFTLLGGAKYIYSTFVNKVDASIIQNAETQNSEALSSSSSMSEKIAAGYLLWNWDFNEKIRIDGGLRYEFTDTYLSTPEEDGLVDREFGNFFPNLTFSYQPSELQTLQFSYARRIIRPTYNDLAPFIFFTGPESNIGGNATLRPSLSDNWDITYTHSSWWLSIKYNEVKQVISRLQPMVDQENYGIITRSENGEYERIWSASAGLPLDITPWWEIQMDINLFYRQFRTAHYEQNFGTENFYFTGNTTFSFALPNSFSLELSGLYISDMFWGVWQIGEQSQVNFGVKKSLKNSSTLTLSFNDIFSDFVWDGSTYIPPHRVSNSFAYDLNMRSVNLTYSQRFGNKKLKAVSIKSGSEEERKRIN
jgi:hypothetical protein